MAANTGGATVITGKPQTAAAQMQQMMEARLQAIKDEVGDCIYVYCTHVYMYAYVYMYVYACAYAYM